MLHWRSLRRWRGLLRWRGLRSWRRRCLYRHDRYRCRRDRLLHWRCLRDGFCTLFHRRGRRLRRNNRRHRGGFARRYYRRGDLRGSLRRIERCRSGCGQAGLRRRLLGRRLGHFLYCLGGTATCRFRRCCASAGGGGGLLRLCCFRCRCHRLVRCGRSTARRTSHRAAWYRSLRRAGGFRLCLRECLLDRLLISDVGTTHGVVKLAILYAPSGATHIVGRTKRSHNLKVAYAQQRSRLRF